MIGYMTHFAYDLVQVYYAHFWLQTINSPEPEPIDPDIYLLNDFRM